jgi:hypothetical protein
MTDFQSKIEQARKKAQRNDAILERLDDLILTLEKHVNSLDRADKLRQDDIAKTDDSMEQIKTALVFAKTDISEQTADHFKGVTEVVESMGSAVDAWTKEIDAKLTNLSENMLKAVSDIKVVVNHPDVKVNVPEPKIIENDKFMDKYVPSDSDTTTQNEYHGHIAKDGSWYIMKVSHDENSVNYRFKSGKRNYRSGWTKREDHQYKRLNETDI